MQALNNFEDKKSFDDNNLNESTNDFDNYILSEENENIEKKNSIFLILLKILISPIDGWKELRRRNIKTEKIQSDCFYPLLAILAMANFINFLYVPHISVSTIVIDAVKSFISFFFGYFCIIILLRSVLPYGTNTIFTTEFGKNFILMALSSLCLFSILLVLFPMVWAILIFSPLWTIYSVCKGIRFFKLPSKGSVRFILTVCSAIILVPLGLEWLFNSLLP